MSEICEEIANQTVIATVNESVKQFHITPDSCLEKTCVVPETEAIPSLPLKRVEKPAKNIVEPIENSVESKSDISSNPCSISSFESSTSSRSISKDSSPSKYDNNKECLCTPLNEDEEKADPHIKTYENTFSADIPSLINNNLIEENNLEPARIHSSSTVSLNESTYVSTLSKSEYSKSADNVSTVHSDVTKKPSCDNLDTEMILSEFSSQKSKVTATQNITPEPENVEYTHIPKETLSQDLGSLVKNVHGIFSSVSGSIKNAYNISHNYRNQKQATKPVKVIPNNRILNEIFDEDEKVKENNVDKIVLELNTEIPVSLEEVGNEGFEKMYAEQRKEMAILKEKLKQQADEVQAKELAHKAIENKIEMMRKRLENAEREKDAAVMRYAGGERAVIEARRAADTAARAEKHALGELDLVNGKLKSAHAEKQRICRLYDDKCHELMASEREVAKIKEDTKEMEGRLKWTQSKLRMEMDAYKDSAEKAEKLEKQVSELEAAKEAAANNAADAMRARQLESELKESQAALILCRHEREDLERRLTNTTQSLESCEKEREECSSALSLANDELKKLRESNLRLEEEASQLASLRAHAALAHSLSTQLQRESERASQAEEALSKERARAETCAVREARALEHAARLTAEHVAARAASSDLHAKEQALTADNASLRERVAELEEATKRLDAALSDESERRSRESRALARKIAELTSELTEAKKQLEWEKGETCVLQKKHASALKELNRELQRALKRCDQLESKLPPGADRSIRTGSVSSLSSGESPPERMQNGLAVEPPEIQAKEPDRQALIERIVSLQRAAARRAERCDFLEEHCRQLTADCRDKGRLLRQALCDTAPPHAPDRMKRDIARLGGGAMAAVWGGEPGELPHELSVEMTRRLQAVLEDALLKNICLKENVDTLSKEIARLKGSTTDSKS